MSNAVLDSMANMYALLNTICISKLRVVRITRCSISSSILTKLNIYLTLWILDHPFAAGYAEYVQNYSLGCINSCPGGHVLRTCRGITRRTSDIGPRCSWIVCAREPRCRSRLCPRGSSGVVTCVEVRGCIRRCFRSICLKISFHIMRSYAWSGCIPYTRSGNLGRIIPRSNTRCPSSIISSCRCTSTISITAPCRSTTPRRRPCWCSRA
jgi:hypothetical protein